MGDCRPDKNLVDIIKRGLIGKGRVLDLCTGVGTQAIYLAKQGFEVYGIEISATAFNIANERSIEKNVACNLTLGDAVHLSYPDKFFSFAFDRGCFHTVKPELREKFVSGVHRVLEKNDKYFLMCFSWRNGSAWNHFTKEDIVGYFSGNFEILENERGYIQRECSGTEGVLFLHLNGGKMEPSSQCNFIP